MPANSFQNALCPDGKYAVPAGELHLLDEGDRNAGWDISVNPTTSWVEYDLGPSATGSKRVPKGTKALWGFASLANTDAFAVLHFRDAASAETDPERTRGIQHGQATSDRLGVAMIIKATDGKFDIKEQSLALEVLTFAYVVHGYFL